MKKTLRILIPVLLLGIIILQFFRGPVPRVPADPEADLLTIMDDGLAVKRILKTSCYDCHSAETNYPWYERVVPFSWWMYDHVEEGTEHLNFSIWETYSIEDKREKLDELIEEVEEGNMPLESYNFFHENAVLHEKEVQELVSWAESYKESL